MKRSRRDVLALGAAAVASTAAGTVVWLRRSQPPQSNEITAGEPPTTSTSSTTSSPSTTSAEAASTTTTTPIETTSTTSTQPPPSTQPTDAPTTPLPTAPAVVPVEVLCRAAWGAAAAGRGTPHTIGRVTVHHSAGRVTDNRRGPGNLREYQWMHQATNGWIDIAYHFAIDAKGNIYEARALGVVGDTSTSYDPTGHFLVMLDGNFEGQPVPEPQFDALAKLVAWALREFGLPPEVVGAHRDFARTLCPGEALYARMRSGELAAKIATHRNSTLEFRMICGAEATAWVQAIEA